LVFFALYLASSKGVVCSNDGSTYALMRATAEEGTWRIDRYAAYAEYSDVARYRGHYYSDRPPGTAMVGLPIYLVVRALAPSGQQEALTKASTPLVAALCGGLTVGLLFLFARVLGASLAAALLTAVGLGLGTLLWTYSTTLFSHVVAGSPVLGAVYLGTTRARAGRLSSSTLAVCGLLLGFAAISDYPTVGLGLVAGVYLLLVRQRGESGESGLGWERMWPLLVGGAIPLIFFAVYNDLCFGAPWSYSYAHHQAAYSRRVGTSFTSPLRGIINFLFTGPGSVNLFRATPLFLLAVPGLALLWKRDRGTALLCCALVTAQLLVSGSHVRFWGHGRPDTRYLLAIKPYLMLPLFGVLDAGRAGTRWAPLRPVLWTAALALLLRSVLNQMEEVAAFYHHGLEESGLRFLAGAAIAQWPRWILPALFDPGFGAAGRTVLFPAIGVLAAALALWLAVGERLGRHPASR